MGFFEFATVAVVFGCGTGVICTIIDKIFGGKNKIREEELKVDRKRLQQLELQLADAHRQNDQLQKQLELHTKMLDTQDRLMKQLADSGGRSSERSGERAIAASRS
jgi:uncharacterized membrane protein (DUF106 family)